MKLSFHGATTMTSNLETDVKISAVARFYALEVWVKKVDAYLESHSLQDLQNLFLSYNVQPVALDAIEFIGFRGNEFPQIEMCCLQLAKLAQALHCPTIAVVPSPLPNIHISWAEVVSEYVTVLQRLSEITKPYQINLAFEFLGMGWSSVRTPRGAWEIVQKTNRDNVGMVIDTAHFYAGGGLLSELEELQSERIFALHLDDLEDTPKEAANDATRLFPGDGVIPLHEICSRLSKIGYEGHCSIELFRPAYWQQDPLEIAKKAMQSARSVLSPYFSLEDQEGGY